MDEFFWIIRGKNAWQLRSGHIAEVLGYVVRSGANMRLACEGDLLSEGFSTWVSLRDGRTGAQEIYRNRTVVKKPQEGRHGPPLKQ